MSLQCYWPESRIKIRVAVNSFATTGRECTLPSQYGARHHYWPLCSARGKLLLFKFPEEYDLEIFWKWSANPLVSVSWKGLRKPAWILRNSGRHRCRSVFTSWEISAPGIRVLLFVMNRRQKTVICHKSVQSDFWKSLQNWKYRLKSEKQCLESERNFATFLTCSLFLVWNSER